ncbi:hypothetical protein LARV_01035 [Longilinea arvoryzae]|uniref:Uncharacterized protein n=1 Tax=Longilinea arvoryzae TaxID=360412 RepID=A0A0S7BGX3_9CHLR|nr:hypothetical protein [Longilinea arvoryzae]GAP13282.1 hypothetical protein LARV_01035 [Longilinea arvoryzae]
MENQQPVEKATNRLFGYLLITVFFVVVLFAGLFAIKGYFASQEEKNFRSRASALVLASESLGTLADQGVDNAEFASLLGDVKAQYSAAGDWPLKYTAANYEYVQAIQGWSLASEVWDAKVVQNSEYAFQDSVDLDGLSTYLGIGTSKLKFFTASDLIRQLMINSKEHAEKGKTLLGY